jgi:peptidoglycan/LPS O-acetylase OafA/YrhL
MLGAPVLQPVAILSYSLYLVHMTVIPAAFTSSKGLNVAIIGVSIPNICFFSSYFISDFQF